MIDGNNAWTTEETANFLGVHVETVRRLARRGEIPAFKVGSDWRFRKSSVHRWAETQHFRGREPLVLVLHDDSHLLARVESALDQEGYRLVSTSDTETAIDITTQQTLTVLLTDLKAEDDKTKELLETFRNENPHMPVIALSRKTSETGITKMLKHAPLLLLPEPPPRDMLNQTVDLLLQGASQVK